MPIPPTSKSMDSLQSSPAGSLIIRPKNPASRDSNAVINVPALQYDPTQSQNAHPASICPSSMA